MVGPLPVDDPRVQVVLADATADEVDESSLDSVPSGVFVALDGDGRPAAGCGWHPWPHDVAHVGVLAATSRRGGGFAASAASAALAEAASAGLLPQWRAAAGNAPSIALAERLGLTRVGGQLSVLPC